MGRSLGVYYLLVIQVHMFLVIHGARLPKWLVQAHCGDHISQSDTAGTLLLESNELPKGVEECKLTVSPRTLPGNGGRGRVLLYFTEFQFPEPCSEFNVTLLDGSSSLRGAPDPLCRYNDNISKKETVFTTSGGSFIVIIRWTDTNTSPSGSFVLKFSSYYDGRCSNSKDVTRCRNSRCTPSEFYCHYNIDTCGPWDNHVCGDDEDEDEDSDGDGNAFLLVFTIITTMLALPCLGYCCVHFASACFPSYSRRPQRRSSPFRGYYRRHETEVPVNPQESEERISFVQDDERQASERNSIYSSDSSHSADQAAPPPPYHSLAMVPYIPSVPSLRHTPSSGRASSFRSSPQPSAPGPAQPYVPPYVRPSTPPSPPPPSYDTVSAFQSSTPSIPQSSPPSGRPSTPPTPPPPSYDTVSPIISSTPSVPNYSPSSGRPSTPPSPSPPSSPPPPSYHTVTHFTSL